MNFIRNASAGPDLPYGKNVSAIVNAESTERARQFLVDRRGDLETPLRTNPRLAQELGLQDLFIKDERERLSLSSFKALGGQYAVLRRAEVMRQTQRGDGAAVFVAATDGNHGISVASGARSAGCRSCIFVPDHVKPAYLTTMEAFGAEIVHIEGDYDVAVYAAASAARKNGWTLVADTTDEEFDAVTFDVMAGYGILVDECLAQIEGDGVTHLFVQGGVGGLAAAVAGGFWERLGSRRPKIIVVEPTKADCLFQTARAGEITRASGDLLTNMSMLSCGWPSRMAWTVLKNAADYFMTISDGCAEIGMRSLNEAFANPNLPTTPSGAAGLSGLIRAAEDSAIRSELDLNSRSRVLVICTESTPDPAVVSRILSTAELDLTRP